MKTIDLKTADGCRAWLQSLSDEGNDVSIMNFGDEPQKLESIPDEVVITMAQELHHAMFGCKNCLKTKKNEHVH